MFKIVSTLRKGGRIELCTVPASWEIKGKLHWPKKNGELLSRNSNILPQPDWPIFNCRVKRRGFLTYDEAEEELTQMLRRTDTDDTDYNEDVQSNNNPSTSMAVNDFNAMAQSMVTMIDSGSTSTVTEHPLSNLEAHSINGHIYEVIAEGPQNEGHHYTAPVQEQDNGQSNITNELLILITQNQEKIMKKLAEISVQLAEVKENNSPFVCTLAQAKGSQNKKFIMKPIDTVEELENFNKQLADPSVFENLLEKYSILCSVSEGTGYNCAYRLLDALFSKKILCECSWTGGSRGPNVKIGFKSYKNTINFFFEMVHTWDFKYTMEHNEEFLKSVLRNALKRKDTKNIRKSSKKSKNTQKLKNNEVNKNDKVNANNEVDESKALDNIESYLDGEGGPSTSNNIPDIDEEEEDEYLC